MMKKVIWLDIGTHFGQEYQSVFGNNFTFYFACLKRFASFLLLRRGFWFEKGDLTLLLRARQYLRSNRRRFSFYFIEANPNIILSQRVYRGGAVVFNFAIVGGKKNHLGVTKLFLPGNDKFSEGSSVFRDKKDFPGKFDANNFIEVLGLSAPNFFSALQSSLEDSFGKDFSLLIRINCEGVEDDVIYAAYQQFGSSLKLVCGSVKDVKICKGKDSYEALLEFMDEKTIPYVPFSPGMSSWLSSYQAIQRILASQ